MTTKDNETPAHVAGPWKYHLGRGANPRFHVQTMGGYQIASTPELSKHAQAKEENASREANARLIAAAPELLEELCNAREWLDELCGLIQFRRLDAACDWVEANAASIDGTLAATIEKAIGEPVMAA